MDNHQQLSPPSKLKRSTSESDIEVIPSEGFTNRRISADNVFIRMDKINKSPPRNFNRIAFRSCSCLPEVSEEDVDLQRIPSFVHLNGGGIHPCTPDIPSHGYPSPPTTPKQPHLSSDVMAKNVSPCSSNCRSSVGPLCRICLEGKYGYILWIISLIPLVE